MIDQWVSLLLGVLQGLTEFLPVSSSGHLVIAQHFLPGFGEANLLFDTIVHCGTLIAVVVYFRKIIITLLRDAALSLKSLRINATETAGESVRYCYFLAVATLPAGVVGGFAKDSIESLFSSPMAAASCLIVTGIILAISDVLRRPEGTLTKKLTTSSALLIGVAQAFAITPGISRSGSTIAVALMLGLGSTEAATFSFLLSIPAIAGALVLQLPDFLELAASESGVLTPYLIGFSSALVSGYAAVTFLLRFVKRHKLLWFSIYCWLFASVAIALLTCYR